MKIESFHFWKLLKIKFLEMVTKKKSISSIVCWKMTIFVERLCGNRNFLKWSWKKKKKKITAKHYEKYANFVNKSQKNHKLCYKYTKNAHFAKNRKKKKKMHFISKDYERNLSNSIKRSRKNQKFYLKKIWKKSTSFIQSIQKNCKFCQSVKKYS